MLVCRDALMEECVRMMQQTLRAAPTIKKRAKSVYQQRNLGTIKDRKREKKQEKRQSDRYWRGRFNYISHLNNEVAAPFCLNIETA